MHDLILYVSNLHRICNPIYNIEHQERRREYSSGQLINSGGPSFSLFLRQTLRFRARRITIFHHDFIKFAHLNLSIKRLFFYIIFGFLFLFASRDDVNERELEKSDEDKDEARRHPNINSLHVTENKIKKKISNSRVLVFLCYVTSNGKLHWKWHSTKTLTPWRKINLNSW